MSNQYNDALLDELFQKYLELGYDDHEAERLEYLEFDDLGEEFTMDKIKLTEEQIDYIATHIEEEHAFIVGLRTAIENAVEAYNGGAR